MPAKIKDKKIILYNCTSKPNANGINQKVYTPIHPGKLWAYVRQLSAKEYFAAMAAKVTEEMIFQVNWRSDLNIGNVLSLYVVYRGLWYSVGRIDTYEGYKQDLKLHATLFAMPTTGTIEEYQE